MIDKKMNTFEVILLLVGVTAGYLGFQLINRVYLSESGKTSWLMIIAIFSWLTLLIMFILLSLTVDMSKRELREIKELIHILSEDRKKK